MAQDYWFVNAIHDGRIVTYSNFLPSYEAAYLSLHSAKTTAPYFDWRISKLVDSVSVASPEPAPVAAAPEERIDILARMLGQANDRIDELAKRVDARSTGETADEVRSLNKRMLNVELTQESERAAIEELTRVHGIMRRRIEALEERTTLERGQDTKYINELSIRMDMLAKRLDQAIDRVAKLENPDITGRGLLGVLDAHNERIGKIEKAIDGLSWFELGGAKFFGAPEGSTTAHPLPRMVRAAFDEEWAPNLTQLDGSMNWVAINRDGEMKAYQGDPEPEFPLNPDAFPNRWKCGDKSMPWVQSLGKIDIERLKIDWRASKRKVVR